MERSRLVCALVATLTIGCSRISGAHDLEIFDRPDSGEAGAPAGGAPADSGGAPAIDYQAGVFETSNLSSSPNTISLDAKMVFADDIPIVAWAEADSITTADEDIFAGPSGQAARITFSSSQESLPSLTVGTDGQALLTWTDNDIYVAAGPGFSAPHNLTDFSAETDFQSAIASGGDLNAVAYVTSMSDSNEVRVATWTTSITAAAPPISVITGQSCWDTTLVVDFYGKLHVLAECDGKPEYASNSSGNWLVTNIGGGTTGNRSPSLVLAADGKTLVATWISGANEILWTQSLLGESWSAPALVAQDAQTAAIAIDRDGRLLVAFERRNPQGNGDVFFAWQQSNGKFAPEIDLTPQSDATDESNPSAVALDPQGFPVILYQAVEPNSEPLNVDIWQAKFLSN